MKQQKETTGYSEILHAEAGQRKHVAVEKGRDDVREKIASLLRQFLQERIPNDWINVTPEMTRRTQKALEEGTAEEEILTEVLEEMIVGPMKDPSSHRVLEQLVQLSVKDPSMKSQLRRMVEVASKLREQGYELPIYDIMTLAGSGSSRLLETDMDSSDKQKIEQLLAA